MCLSIISIYILLAECRKLSSSPTSILASVHERPPAEEETKPPAANHPDSGRLTSCTTGPTSESPDETTRKPEADPELLADLEAIARRCARILGPGPSSLEIGDFLYDERGLPK